ncbi:thiamine biosynthesis lipoprotein ApbE [Fervidicella metallireducens AeB]|uniref:FAD:protein FMN transferase n=1 Tax=Fervidicella metallireducens AeB TaxID=1403537 RepID=A0A017RZJ0_9CLOT|nr:FAD:protein FMN transferase [Fervidicella metallireducens]EYE89360.1 thiamine biosynthesis lipoprotein ApbE [Fervidicella metallireducens AeB]
MSNRKKLIFILLVISISAFVFIFSKYNHSVSKKNSEPISKSDFFFGTVVDIKIYDEASEEIFKDVFSILDDIEKKMSINLNNSEISKINNNAGSKEIVVSPETFYVIKKGKYYSSLSKGNFDISIGPLVKLWGIGSENPHLPSSKELKKAIALIDYNNILLDDAKSSVKLLRKGMMLDLGGIAKGYAADEIAKYLNSRGIENAIINLGGNVYAMGQNPALRPWNIGVQNPFDLRGKYIGILHVKNKTVVTSGIYERYFEKNGKRYHHILNPFTGYPVENSLASVSIVADKSIDADALSTTLFSLGIEKGSKLAESLDGVDAIFITKDKKVYITSGLKNIFEISDENFKLISSFR